MEHKEPKYVGQELIVESEKMYMGWHPIYGFYPESCANSPLRCRTIIDQDQSHKYAKEYLVIPVIVTSAEPVIHVA